jgi:hypothetical protein
MSMSELDEWERQRIERLRDALDRAVKIRRQANFPVPQLSSMKIASAALRAFIRRVRADVRQRPVREGGMELFFATVAMMLMCVQACLAGPVRRSDVIELNDGILAYAVGDHAKAIRLLLPFAEINQPLAELLLGRIYVHSPWAAHDCGRGAGWLARAADHGNAEAAFDLGDLYKRGDCVAKSETAALQWFMKAAAEGYQVAPYAIAKIYLGSSDQAPDYAASIRWLLRAVKLFDGGACYRLGMMYARGEGVNKNYEAAFKWFELSSLLSAHYGNEPEPARDARDRIREQLTPAQVAFANADADRMLAALIEENQDPTHSRTVDALVSIQQANHGRN